MPDKNFMPGQKGATTVEYALIMAGVAVAISAVVFTFGGDLSGLFKQKDPVANEKVEEPTLDKAKPVEEKAAAPQE